MAMEKSSKILYAIIIVLLVLAVLTTYNVGTMKHTSAIHYNEPHHSDCGTGLQSRLRSDNNSESSEKRLIVIDSDLSSKHEHHDGRLQFNF